MDIEIEGKQLMNTTIRNLFVSLVLFSLLLSAGCSAAPQAATPTTAAAIAVTDTIAPTETQAPSATETDVPTKKPSATASETSAAKTTVIEETQGPTSTSTSTDTPEPTAVKIADWSSAKYYTGGALAHWQYFIALEFDGNITGSYYAIVDKNKDYKCTVLPMYPNRLYCDGPQAAFMDYVDFVVYDATTDQQVFQDRIWIPGTYYSEYTN